MENPKLICSNDWCQTSNLRLMKLKMQETFWLVHFSRLSLHVILGKVNLGYVRLRQVRGKVRLARLGNCIILAKQNFRKRFCVCDFQVFGFPSIELNGKPKTSPFWRIIWVFHIFRIRFQAFHILKTQTLCLSKPERFWVLLLLLLLGLLGLCLTKKSTYIKGLEMQIHFRSFRNSNDPDAFSIVGVRTRKIGGLEYTRRAIQVTTTNFIQKSCMKSLTFD